MQTSALMTDLYELTMLAGYHRQGMHERPACFELFFRTPPFRGGYAIFAGLEPALRYLEQLHFPDSDLAYLDSLGLFEKDFLDYLAHFRFRCDVAAPPEGTPVFAHEPLVTVCGPLAEAQLVETALLNIINFQSLIATKAARVQQAAGVGTVVEFGLRRAQGPDGGLSVARAAYIGGVTSTSNCWAGQQFGIPIKGTHAHSWVMAFPSELAAFRAYAEAFPDSSILLVDTYDTLTSGLPNALVVAQELRANGHELRGVRLDSGDLARLSREARQLFDDAGFPGVRIVASSELDEYRIEEIRRQGGRVDIYGVGTELASAGGPGGGALGGVYKLVDCAGSPRMKITSDPRKATLPGAKSLFRLSDGQHLLDVIACKGEPLRPGDALYDPSDGSCRPLPDGRLHALQQRVMTGGALAVSVPPLAEVSDHCRGELEKLAPAVRAIHGHRPYQVLISAGLQRLREQLLRR